MPSDPQIKALIRSLPKAELHLHLEGSVDPPTLAELSRRHNTPLPAENNNGKLDPASGQQLTEEDVGGLYQYGDFLGFLKAFKAVTERLRTAEDYELITYRLMQKLHAQNVVHAEVYVSVGVIQWRKQDFAAIFEGLERGRLRGEKDFGISLLWIFDAVRQFGVDAARTVFATAAEYRNRNVIGIGIGGDEQRGPAEWFTDVYRDAARAGLRLTCHAGESDGPESVAKAMDLLGTERIGHGVTAIQDPELVRRIAERQLPIEICLSSNLRTGCCPHPANHPLRQYFDAGALVLLNTDDPEMFQTSLTREYELAHEIHGFSANELRQMARNSFTASFLPEAKKLELLKKVI